MITSLHILLAALYASGAVSMVEIGRRLGVPISIKVVAAVLGALWLTMAVAHDAIKRRRA